MSSELGPSSVPANGGQPTLPKVVLAVGSTLALVGGIVYSMNPTAGFYLVLASTAIAHFAAYLGWK